MEYERALFRVYERCLESIIPNNPVNTTKSCEIIEYLVLIVTMLMVGILSFLHIIFVGNTGCLPMKLQEYALAHNQSTFNFTNDQIIQIFLDENSSDLFDISDYSGRRVRRLQDPDVPILFDEHVNETSFTSNSMILPDYEFASSWAVLELSPEIRKKHNFEIVNISYTPGCFGSVFQQKFVPFGGTDVIVLNNLMKTIPTGGVLDSLSGGRWSWPNISHKSSRTYLDWLSLKLTILLKALFSFFTLSTTTALLVRILISSGVVLLLPFFWLLQLCGLHVLNSRIFTLSYPWLGVPMEILRIRQRSTVPFLISHITRVFIYYLMYEASSYTLTFYIYHDHPGPKDLWLYAIVMILEYYSMIYLRSSLAIRFFPPVSLLLFLLYHIYLFSFPSGFHLLALLCLFLAYSHLMIFTLRKFEIPLYLRGIVSIEAPRELYNALPWPSWALALAPEYTIFMPLTHRARSIYDTLPGNNDDNYGPNQFMPPPPPNYNTLMNISRWRPPTPVDLLSQYEPDRYMPLGRRDTFDLMNGGNHDDQEEEEDDEEEEEEEEDEKDDVEDRGPRHVRFQPPLNTLVNRLQSLLDDTESDDMLRLEHEHEHEERKEDSSSQDIEMGSHHL